MSWDIVARALFVDNGAAAGIAKFNSQIHDVAKAAPGGTRGLYAIERGLQTLAFEAVGVQGPIGRVAEGLLKFGGGSALVLGAAAGIGLIAGAYRLANAEAAGLAETNEKLNKTWADLMARGHPTVTMQNELTAAIVEQTKAQEKLDKLSATVATPHGRVTRGTAGEIAEAQTNLDAARRNVDAFRDKLNQAHAQLIADAAKNGEKWATAFVEGISHLDPNSQIKTLLLARGQFDAIGGNAGDIFATAYLKALNERLAGWGPTPRMPGATGPLQTYDFRGPAELFEAAHRPFTAGGFGAGFDVRAPGFGQGVGGFDSVRTHTVLPEPAEPGKSKLDIAQIAAASVAVMGAISQGGAGGILSATGGLASSLGAAKSAGGLGIAGLGPIGIGLTALGGVVSLLDSGADRRNQKLLEELVRIRQNTTHRGEPDHISLTVTLNGKEISGAILGDVIYGINRLARKRGTPILPSSGA